jgi:uroporphyrinogen decarboxylase
VFDNKQAGVIGEVKKPLIQDWEDLSAVHFPEERLSVDIEKVNAFCAQEERFVQAGTYPRPFERLQFLRGTEDLLMDIASEEEGLFDFIQKLHEFYTQEMELWAKTDVDALIMIDDWGTQNNMLINPRTWREVFKPIYKTYADIAHDSGKKIFMHSDGNILEIYPDLIEIGIDALNSQLFCMGLDKLAPFKEKITFWGEMDRQHILPNGTEQEVAAAVQQVYDHLFDSGGVIAQCEFGPGANPANVRALYAAWDRMNL